MASPLSKAELEREKYTKDLRDWLSAHGSKHCQKYEENFENVQHYKKFIDSLDRERRPYDTASFILATENLPKDQPVPVTKVGAIIKKKIKNELKTNPIISCLSPALILTQQRRKEVISKLENFNWPLETTTDTPAAPVAPKQAQVIPLTFQEDQSFLGKGHLREGSYSPTRFTPKWEDYDTMKVRFKYLKPQTKRLVGEREALVPTTSTATLKAHGTVLSGKQVDIDYYQSRVDAKNHRAMNLAYRSVGWTPDDP